MWRLPQRVKAVFCLIGARVGRSALPNEFAGPSSTLLFLEYDDDGRVVALEIGLGLETTF